MRQILIPYLILFSIFIGACKNGPDMVRPYGSDKTVVRPLSPFNSIKVGQKFELYITQDSSLPEQCTIVYGSNLIDNIETRVQDGELVFRDKNHFNWVRKLDVMPRCTVNIRTLEKLDIEGSAKVICLDSLKLPELDLIMNSTGAHVIMLNAGILSGGSSNTGHILFVGRANIFTYSCENGSWFDANTFSCDDAYVRLYTDHDIVITPKNIFEAYTYAKGNIYYHQDPVVSFKKLEQGEGRVLKE